MTRKITHADLLQYAYNETGLLEGDRIQRSIDGDPITASEFQEITSLMELLDGATPAISECLIEKVKKFC